MADVARAIPAYWEWCGDRWTRTDRLAVTVQIVVEAGGRWAVDWVHPGAAPRWCITRPPLDEHQTDAFAAIDVLPATTTRDALKLADQRWPPPSWMPPAEKAWADADVVWAALNGGGVPSEPAPLASVVG